MYLHRLKQGSSFLRSVETYFASSGCSQLKSTALSSPFAAARRFTTTNDDTEGVPESTDLRPDSHQAESPASSGTSQENRVLVDEGVTVGELHLPRHGSGPTNNLDALAVEFEQYLDSGDVYETSAPIYDIPSFLGDDSFIHTAYAEQMQAIFEEHPEIRSLYEEEEDEPPYPGARPILRWTQHGILPSTVFPGNNEPHPLNKKAECVVHMKELQDELALSDDAVKYIIAICGPRYNATTGELRLVSERYREREDNRRHIVEQLFMLADEGERVFPNPSKEDDLRRHRERCREEGERLGQQLGGS